MGRLPPCKGCEKRDYPRCHSECPEYLAFRVERELISKKHQEEVLCTTYEIQRNRRIKRKTR